MLSLWSVRDLDQASMKKYPTRVTTFDDAQSNNKAHMYMVLSMMIDICLW
jgi:hypothetical protein